tara:strand:+ start:2631 stop:3827 length:1197 start_codon:yes stop_codon:yes gene_type:complete
MLQRLIHSARVNVFESARFYYWVLIVLTSYFLVNRFLQKLSYVYLDDRWAELKIGEGVLFGLAYGFVLISAWFLQKKIPRYVFWCWGGIILIFLINEFRFAWGNPYYSHIESLTKSQGYYTAKFTMPILFWGIWSVLKEANHYGLVFVTQLQRVLTINAILIIAGAVFDISAFESYPLSGRWGYSGFLLHLSFHGIAYGVFLIYLLEKKKKAWGYIIIYGLVLLLLGQKAGLLYFMLIFTLVLVTTRYLQWGIISSCFVIVFSAQLWLPYVVTLSPFWENVYNKYGVWGVVLSLRNENIEKIWGIISPQLSAFDVIFGGVIRFPMRIEMMLFDILIYFGVLGLIIFILLIIKIVPSWKWSVPILVACFSGGIHEAPLGMLLFLLVLGLGMRNKHSHSP